MSAMKRFLIHTGRKVKRKQHLLSLPNKSGFRAMPNGNRSTMHRDNNNSLLTKNFNAMNIIGRLTRNAEVHTTPTQKEVVNFTVAVNDSYKNKQGERIEQTTYFDCAYWLTTAIAPHLTKGTLVGLSGRASARAWTGKDGEPKAGLNFHTSQIEFYGGSKKTQTTQDSTEPIYNGAVTQDVSDDLPF
jgi:single-strand DNA-binding protein